MTLTEKEIKAINTPPADIKHPDHRVLVSAFNKLSKSNDKQLVYACAIRLAISLDKSRIPHYEKAQHWEIAANKAQEASRSSSELYAVAAELFGRDMAHKKSAELFKKSATGAVEEKSDKKRIQSLFQECRRQYELFGDGESAGEVFILENNYRLGSLKGLEKLFLFLYKLLSVYGESPSRVALSAFIVIVTCAGLYYVSGIYSPVNQEIIHSLPTSIYFSIVTFTTLGYGDYSPASSYARVISSCEAVSGLLFTSLFLVTVVRKYSR